jgi:hypothetical protein
MSSGALKKALRSAREALSLGQHREALAHCKEALAEDKGCYDAYV